MTKMRILIFTDPTLSSIVEALSKYTVIKKVDYHFREIPGGYFYLFFKIIYRTIEGLYWLSLMIREIHLFQTDFLIAQYAFSIPGLFGAIAAKLSRKKFVIRVTGGDLKKDAQSFIGRIVILLIFRMASGAICVSNDLRNTANELGAKNTIVIPSPLLLPHSTQGITKNHRQIVTVTRLVPEKGIDYLIKAMSHIKGGSLLIIGDGPERTKLELLSKKLKLTDRISFVGWVSDRSKISYYLRQGTIFVLPTYFPEGRPRVIIEAMACGLPVIATNTGGIPEIVKNCVNGIIVKPKDKKALAKAINCLLTNKEFQKNASIENINEAKKYLPSIIGQKIFNYLRSF